VEALPIEPSVKAKLSMGVVVVDLIMVELKVVHIMLVVNDAVVVLEPKYLAPVKSEELANSDTVSRTESRKGLGLVCSPSRTHPALAEVNLSLAVFVFCSNTLRSLRLGHQTKSTGG
jgi:hypothetical protein